MSIEVKTDSQSAESYNAKAIINLSLEDSLPLQFIEKYDVSLTPKGLVEGVVAFQREKDLLVDGKLGPQTLDAIIKAFDDQQDYFLVGQRRIKTSSNLVRYNEEGGLDLHPVAHFNPRFFNYQRPIKRIVLHWGGLNPEHLYRCMSGVRKVSTHLGVGILDGEARTYQYLNFMHKAWHCGNFNGSSLGIDICQQPQLQWEKRYKAEGYKVFEMQNTSGRGDANCLSLDDRILEELVVVLKDLFQNFLKEEIRAPKNNEVQKCPEQFNLLGHHHISKKKWDVAPWWDEIIEAL